MKIHPRLPRYRFARPRPPNLSEIGCPFCGSTTLGLLDVPVAEVRIWTDKRELIIRLRDDTATHFVIVEEFHGSPLVYDPRRAHVLLREPLERRLRPVLDLGLVVSEPIDGFALVCYACDLYWPSAAGFGTDWYAEGRPLGRACLTLDD